MDYNEELTNMIHGNRTGDLLAWMLPESTPLSQPVGLLWTSMTLNFSKFQIATFGTVLMHEVVLFIGCLPGFLAQYIPGANRYKIQPNRRVTLTNQWACLKIVMFNQFCIQLPMLAVSYICTQLFDVPLEWDLVPPWYVISPRMLACLVIEDTWHYFTHRALHTKFLYKHIHKVHHYYQSPFGLVAEYAHPAEQLFIGLGTFFGAMLLCDHLFLMWLWFGLRVLEIVDAHCGYYFPISIFRLLPFHAGPKFHDFHHYNFKGNYASIFTWWDWLLGTDVQYKQYKAKLSTWNKTEGKKKF